MHTGDKTRIIRDIKGLSQDNVAHDVGITRNAYGDMERGKLGISEKRLEQIASALGVTPKDIHNFDDKMANFFEQGNHNAVNVGESPIGPQTNNYFNQQELQHRLEKAELEIKNLTLELENQRISREKAELETTLLRERFERTAKSE